MQEFAAMSFSITNDIDYELYNPSLSVMSLHEDTPGPVVFTALPDQLNMALDSVGTNHIICNRCLFRSYNVSGVVPVKTANCGFLKTLAVRDVNFCIVIRGKTVCGH
jgi:ribosomal protein L37E